MQCVERGNFVVGYFFELKGSPWGWAANRISPCWCEAATFEETGRFAFACHVHGDWPAREPAAAVAAAAIRSTAASKTKQEQSRLITCGSYYLQVPNLTSPLPPYRAFLCPSTRSVSLNSPTFIIFFFSNLFHFLPPF